MNKTPRLMVGTKKGAFIYSADESRDKWEVSEPMFPGWMVHHMAADSRRDNPRLYAAANHWAWGRSVARSDDGGKTWDYRSETLAFPKDMDKAVGNVWHVAPGHPDEPGVVYAGTQPAGLFRSEDWGETWAPVEALNRHPYSKFWTESGGGDSCLHSIEIDPRDPKHVYVAIATGGSYVTRDGGESWEICSHKAIATNADAVKMMTDLQAEHPEFFTGERIPDMVDPAAVDEFHKMRIDQKNPNRIWGQSHIGVFLSDDEAKTWQDVTVGLPSFHGFPIAITQREPDAVFVVPLQFEQDNFRVVPDQFAVWRSRDAGKSWESLTKGLPGPNNYQSVYREGLDTDGLDPEGVYVGTSNGQVYASTNGGDSWQRLPGDLPPILSVTAAVF
ncbi:MAG: exo-alpha-sialidase [Dehalococcoidia bacterium]